MNPRGALIAKTVLNDRCHKPSIVPQGDGSLALGRPAEAVVSATAVVLSGGKISYECQIDRRLDTFHGWLAVLSARFFA